MIAPETAEMKRRMAINTHRAFLARMREQDPRHAALYCPDHPKYIGHGNLFPCTDRDHQEG